MKTCAKDIYSKLISSLLEGFTLKESGFIIYEKKLFLGAFPDGNVSSTCCGSGLIEIKCPFSCRDELPTRAYYLNTMIKVF